MTIDIHMFRFIQLLFISYFLTTPHWSSAQQPSKIPFEVGKSGKAYLQEVRFRSIETDVAYFYPFGPPPPMETRQEPKAPPDLSNQNVEWSLGSVSNIVFLVSTGVLLTIGYVFVRYGGNISVSMSQNAGNAVRGYNKIAHSSGTLSPSTSSSLASILGLQDRREALIQLTQVALEAAISADGARLQRSWTAREALRHLPGDQSHMSALRSLVHTSERVHFGGRDVSEEEFQSHVNDIKPLLQSEARA
ncbi:DUF4129 domain-containing protein [Pseudovibrio sp. JE062]|uniref:DUF4129 domain-containing protein n=1 Tax=Pseudovibrio sp. JE062 TaxID=439495 RepID=UPI001AD8CF3A|nr:DUF4129 domain-containing protein [Pseudovibrio sp. JE062]